VRKKLLISITLAAVIFSMVTARIDASQENFKPIVEDAWKAITENFYDSTFNGNDWSLVRQELLAREYPTKQEAYATIKAMLARLGDPATRFLTPEQFTALLNDFSGRSHSGVGLLELLSIDLNEKTKKITIVTPIPDSPAARAGLRPGDQVEAIDGLSTANMSLAEATAKLRGEKDTLVKLSILRGSKKLIVSLKREIITPPTSAVRALVREYGGSKVGYIALSQFTQTSGQEMRKAIEELLKSGVDRFLLDLRNNPGGAVSACQEIAGIFLEQLSVGWTQGREGKLTELLARASKVDRLIENPLVVLINQGSASAAEALAGALQSHRRAKLVGTKTFGKGLIHLPRPLPDGSALIITIARLKTPSVRDLLDKGVDPDVTVESADSPALNPSDKTVATFKDVQYLRAIQLLTEASESKK
jgi:carboxyl-terminal processing protease